VAFSEATFSGAGVRKFVGVGVWAKKFDGDGAEVMEDIDLGCLGISMFSQDSRPEVEAGVVAEFNSGEAEGGDFAKEGSTVGDAVGVPAGGEGEGGSSHSRRVSLKKGTGRRDFSGGEGVGGLKIGEEAGKIVECLPKGFLIVGRCKGWDFGTAYVRSLRVIRYRVMQ